MPMEKEYQYIQQATIYQLRMIFANSSQEQYKKEEIEIAGRLRVCEKGLTL